MAMYFWLTGISSTGMALLNRPPRSQTEHRLLLNGQYHQATFSTMSCIQTPPKLAHISTILMLALKLSPPQVLLSLKTPELHPINMTKN